MPIKGCICASHRRLSRFDRLGYVERQIEAEKRLKKGWKQRHCRYCGTWIWIDATQARWEARKRQAALKRSICQPVELKKTEPIRANENTFELACLEEMKGDILAVLGTLNEREKHIILGRYGIGMKRSYSLAEIAEYYGIGSERVRQIEAKAIRKLQHPIRSRSLDGHVELRRGE
jgi:RNA polymerase sigma factor (sigma-70 family)